MTRRECITLIAAASAARCNSFAQHRSARVSLGFSLYGMKDIPLPTAFDVCAAIGYDSVELCLMPGWSDPDSLSRQARSDLSRQLEKLHLGLAALMEQIYLLDREMPKAVGLERIRKAAALGHDLVRATPRIETVVGGKSVEWEAGKHQMAERL